jgi:DNA-binding PucR family transcriptional regulator
MNDVQELIDSLASRLGRPVGLDDRRFRAIAYSSHEDEIDAVRRTSILGRQAPEPVIDWLEQLGLTRAHDVVRVPGNPTLGMVARLCLPVRFHGRLLGLLWLIDDDVPLTDEELLACRESSDEIAEELYRLRQEAHDERRAEAAWVKAALKASEFDRASPAPLVAAAPMYAALVVAVAFPADAAVPSGVDVRLTDAVDHMRRLVAPRHQLATVEHDRATLIVAGSAATDIERHAGALLTAAETELADIDGAQVLVGIGEPTALVEAFPRSAAAALSAVRLGCSMPELGPLIKWSDLGAMRLIVELVGDRDPEGILPPALRRLLADPDGAMLALTLETYLEHAGDVPAAAAELFIHRSSLYNRLQRIEEIAGVNIRSGADRLELHLGMKLWRMCAAAPRRLSSQLG